MLLVRIGDPGSAVCCCCGAQKRSARAAGKRPRTLPFVRGRVREQQRLLPSLCASARRLPACRRLGDNGIGLGRRGLGRRALGRAWEHDLPARVARARSCVRPPAEPQPAQARTHAQLAARTRAADGSTTRGVPCNLRRLQAWALSMMGFSAATVFMAWRGFVKQYGGAQQRIGGVTCGCAAPSRTRQCDVPAHAPDRPLLPSQISMRRGRRCRTSGTVRRAESRLPARNRRGCEGNGGPDHSRHPGRRDS